MARIGVLDSGLGGFVVLNELKKRYPNQDFVFFADQKYAPYGNKEVDELTEIVNKNIEWLENYGVSSILLACNTTCSIAQITSNVQIQKIIDQTCVKALKNKIKNVLVVGTSITINSHSYQKAINSINKDVKVYELALPYLAKDIEDLVSKEEISEKLKESLNSYIGKVDSVILGCTHYPLVSDVFERILNVPCYDSNSIELVDASDFNGKIEYFTTGSSDYFDEQVKVLFNKHITSVHIDV